MKLLESDKLKETILKDYDQISLFATYFEIAENDINYCLENKNYKISNPLRDDRDPSLGFMTVMDKQSSYFKLKMYDWADPYYRGDIFDLVGKIRHLNSNKALDFITICKDIIYTMKEKTVQHTIKKLTLTKTEPFTFIHIEPRLWCSKDIELWNSFGLPFNEFKHIIFPLKHSFISNYCDYTYDENDPGYAWISGYYDSKTLYTLYFPFRKGNDKFKPRFKKNNKFYPLECIHELKPADILVITKAYKEKLLINRLLPQIEKEHTIQVSNFTSESIVLSNDFVMKLYDIYPTVVTNTDFDYTGLKTSREHKKRYGMLRFVPTNGRFGTYDFGGKDLCEIHAKHGLQYCVDILQDSYNYLKQEIEYEKLLSSDSNY
jgi:hypothetical protein